MFLRRLLRGRDARPPAFRDGTPVPDRCVYAVGDLHGRADLLELMLDRIAADVDEGRRADAALIFLGDYVDRGERAAAVVSRLRGLQRAEPGRVVALMGNHERMMLDFLEDPVQRGRRWLRHGGVQTLASYGVLGAAEDSGPAVLRRAAEALRAAMPAGEAAWLAALPALWRSGDLVCVHAGADPAAPPEAQPAETLIWGHPRFEAAPRGDGVWVVHGHTVVDAPRVERGRIAVDTGAWFSGRLAAARIDADGIAMIEATGG
ncbi:metallophosphoesterase [Jannaschia sp. W003]|uniref:metallophosphoesterase n=1 Tax=Jannaschia sp. W003 TaxID=2867012 RepID=UPI0021A68C13|nr:metallophosphoesterase [Jannaschia sp. W003]UWQ19979.1 metallophosphoesterase [Jannaschia sp. W003]